MDFVLSLHLRHMTVDEGIMFLVCPVLVRTFTTLSHEWLEQF